MPAMTAGIGVLLLGTTRGTHAMADRGLNYNGVRHSRVVIFAMIVYFCKSGLSLFCANHKYWRLWAAFVTVLCSVDNSVQIYEYVYSVVYWYHAMGRVADWPFGPPGSLIDRLIECFMLAYLQCL